MWNSRLGYHKSDHKNLMFHVCLFFVVCWILLKYFFSKKSLRHATNVSSSLDPHMGGRFVGPGLGPVCLQKLDREWVEITVSIRR